LYNGNLLDRNYNINKLNDECKVLISSLNKDLKMNKTLGLSVIFLLLIFTPIRAEWTGTVAEQIITYEQPPGDGLGVRIASFCAAPDGHLYAVYAQTESPSPYTRELYFSKSTDGGITWSGTAGDVMINAGDGRRNDQCR
jgi:hypothetical protein